MIIAGLSNSKELAERIAEKLNVDYDDVELRDSDAGELHVKFNEKIKGNKVVLVQSLFPYTNHALFEMMYAASAARDLGAKKIIYVAPYLAFFREDDRENKGECVNQNVVADLLSRNVDSVVSVEPHLHQHNFPNKLFSIPFYGLKCGEILRRYVRENFKDYNVVGFGDRAAKLAKHVDSKAALFEKGEGVDQGGNKVLIVDDLISTGETMLSNLKGLKAEKINILTVHGLFVDKAFSELNEKVGDIVSCNTIDHGSNKIDVSGLIAGKLMEL
jgi:ribose-phosphate pyrophosphokinase